MTYLVNGIGHFDILGPDIDSLIQFYEATLGWKSHPRGPGYASLETPEGSPDGALVESETPALTLGVVVADLAATLAEAERRGGRIVMPITDNGWVRKAQIADPAGNVLTVIAA